MKQTTLDKWTVTKTVETDEDKARREAEWAEILAWEAVEMREWI